jgi:protein arginine N-methyltransferase 1
MIPTSRRVALEKLTLTPFITTSLFLPSPQDVAIAVTDNDNSDDSSSSLPKTTPISAQWNAVDGLNSLESEKKFVTFDKSAYQAMMNDQSRTPLFEKAIINRLNSAKYEPNSQIVLDLGTGPFALFAVIAAKNGAKHVYAIEASKEAAESARQTIQKLGLEDKITILEGFSTDITLPEKADFAVAEIVGSVASEEGAYATIVDAHKRLVKNPYEPSSWIPNRIQTYAAPASYTLQNLFLPPAFDWTKLQGEPVRFNCRDEGLQLVSNPVLIEDISFADIDKGGFQKKQVTFTVDGERVDKNRIAFLEEFKRGRIQEAETLSITAANSISGIALWPRLLLDDNVDVNSRNYPDGGHQKSHWQTVLPIMNEIPVPVKGGDEVCVTFDFSVPTLVTTPPSYKISGSVVRV